MAAADGISFSGTPATVGAAFQFTSTKDNGAVLITRAPITHFDTGHDARQAFLDWMLVNTKHLLENAATRDTVKERGVWIVTETYSTKRCARRILATTESKASISIDVAVNNITDVRASTTWWNNASDSAWTWSRSVSIFPSCMIKSMAANAACSQKPV